MSADYVALVDTEVEGDVLGSLPEVSPHIHSSSFSSGHLCPQGIRSMILSNLDYRLKFRLLLTSRTLAFCDDAGGLARVRENYFKALADREARDSEQVHCFACRGDG